MGFIRLSSTEMNRNSYTCSKDLEDLARAARSVSEGHAVAISIHC